MGLLPDRASLRQLHNGRNANPPAARRRKIRAGGAMAEDLTKTSRDLFWRRFHEMMGEGGLLTYRYLGPRTLSPHDVPYDSMKLRHDMRNAAGGLLAAPLAIASAEAGGRADQGPVPPPAPHPPPSL